MASGTWTSVATSGAWNTTSNWSGAVVANASGFTANFTSNITATTTIDTTTGANWSGTIGSIVFSDAGAAGSAWALGSQATITLAGGTPTITTTTAATVNGVLAGAAGIVKAGASSLTTTAVNTYSGGTTINAGTWIAAASSPFSTSTMGTGVITIANGATLQANNAHLFGWNAGTFNSITVNSGGTFNLQADNYIGNLTMNGNAVVTGSANFLALATGILSYTGSTASDQGTIAKEFRPQSPLGGQDCTATITGTNSNGDLVISGAFNGSGKLTKAGAGILVMSGASGINNNGVVISVGTVRVAATAALGTGTITVNNASTGSNATTLQINATSGSVTLNNALTVANQGSGTVTVGSATTSGTNLAVFSGAVTLNKNTIFDGGSAGDRLGFSGGISGTANVTIAGTKRVMFYTTAATYAGTTTINANAILQLGDGGATATSFLPDNYDVTVNGILQIAKGTNSETVGALNGSGVISNAGSGAGTTTTLIVGNNNNSGSYSGTLLNPTETLAFTKVGTGTQTLTGANTFIGSVSVTAGTLNANSATALGAANSTAAISVSSGATLSLGAAMNYSSPGRTTTLSGIGVGAGFTALNVANTGTNNLGAIGLAANTAVLGTESGTLSSNINNGTFLLNVGAAPTKTFTLSGVISNGSLSVGSTTYGTGTVILSGANTYTGGTTLAAGTAQANVAQNGSTSGPFGASGSINMTGGTLQYSAANNTDYSARLGTGTNGQWRIDTNGRDVTFGSSLTGATSSLVKIGAGTLALTTSNPFEGGTRISGGTLSFVTGGLSNVGNIVVNGGTLQWGIGVTTDLSDRLVLENGGSASVSMSSNVSFASPVGSSSTSSFTKLGTGDLLMGSANGTWSGATTVSAGSMSIKTLNSGSYSAAIVVNGLSLGVYPTSGTTQTLNGAISGSGKMILNPDATSTIIVSGGSNSYLGGTTLAGGKIVAGNASAFGTGTLTFVSVGAQPVIDVSAPTVISNAINLDDGYIIFAGSNNLELSSNINLPFSRPFTVNGSVLTLSGIVSGSGSKLTKSGTATLKFTNANTYSGGTDIGAGTVQAGNTQALGTSGTVTLTASGATLQTLTTDGQNGKLTVAALTNSAGGTIKIGG